jgi:hypothetical protein
LGKGSIVCYEKAAPTPWEWPDASRKRSRGEATGLGTTLTPQKAPRENLLPTCTVRDFLKRYGTSKEEAAFITGLESLAYYSADPGVSNFRGEFLVVYGHQGVHVVTLVPIAKIPLFG